MNDEIRVYPSTGAGSGVTVGIGTYHRTTNEPTDLLLAAILIELRKLTAPKEDVT